MADGLVVDRMAIIQSPHTSPKTKISRQLFESHRKNHFHLTFRHRTFYFSFLCGHSLHLMYILALTCAIYSHSMDDSLSWFFVFGVSGSCGLSPGMSPVCLRGLGRLWPVPKEILNDVSPPLGHAYSMHQLQRVWRARV